MNAFVIILIIALPLGFLSALWLRQKGYPFWRTVVSSYIGIAGLGVLAYSMVSRYL